jgi:hypothetical protein
MTEATGEIVETATEELLFKAMIKAGEIVREPFFVSRVKAEIYIVETLNGLRVSAGDKISRP